MVHRIPPARTVSILVVAAVLLGTAASMVTVHGDTQPARIDVPVMHHGDRYEYSVEYSSNADGNWNATPYIYVYEVGEPRTVLDANARPTPVVPIRHWIVGLDYQPVFTEHISLESRLVVESEHLIWGAESEENGSVSSFLADNPALPGVPFQGADLVEGTTAEVPARIDQPRAETEGGGGGAGSFLGRYTYGPQRWDPPGRPQLQPDETGSVPVTVGPLATIGDVVSLPINWTETTVDAYATRALNQTMWVAATHPVPLLHEVHQTNHFDDDTTNQMAWRNHLTHIERGAAPVAWGQPSTPPAPPERASTGAFHPADGADITLSYPLSTAIRDVMEVGTDPEWLTWRVEHPDAVLVGAGFSRGAMTWTGEETHEWRLYFSTEGAGYEVRTERHPAAPVARTEAMGPVNLPYVLDAAPPAEPITIAEAERLWRQTFGHDDAAVPTYIHWGLFPPEWQNGSPCAFGVSGGGSPPPAFLDDLRSIQVGQSPHGPCHTTDSSGYYEMLEIEMEGPTLIGTYQTVLEMSGPSPPAGAPADSDDPYLAARSEAGWALVTPSPLESAAVATSLLAVLLTVFFLPAIKFAATQAWIALPGFSRVKRADLLTQKERDRLFAHIEANPGATPTELAKATGLGWGTVVHHLDTLRKHGVVRSAIEGRHRRFFTTESVTVEQIDARALLANTHTQRYYAALVDEPGLAATELAHRIGVSPPGAHHQLRRLEDSGLVERRRDGRHVRYYPRPVPARPYDADAAVEVV